MPGRAKLTKAERERRSRLAQLVHSHGLSFAPTIPSIFHYLPTQISPSNLPSIPSNP